MGGGGCRGCGGDLRGSQGVEVAALGMSRLYYALWIVWENRRREWLSWRTGEEYVSVNGLTRAVARAAAEEKRRQEE